MSQENVEIARKLYERYARGDFVTPDAFDPGIEFERIGAEGRGRCRVLARTRRDGRRILERFLSREVPGPGADSPRWAPHS